MKQKLCGWAGCNKIIPAGSYFCSYHKDISDTNRKESAFKTATRYANYNNPEWRKLSKQYLIEVGHCEKCGSTDNLQVHHIIPVRLAPQLFLERANWQVLCRTCHQNETAREIAERRKGKQER